MPHSAYRFLVLALTPLAACATVPPETSRSVTDSSSSSGPLEMPQNDDDSLAEMQVPNPEPPVPLAVRPQPRPTVRPYPSSPYRVEILDEAKALPTFHPSSTTYVLGSIGSRYRIHVTNPTPRRVEAVVSVDGLDTIDGKPADYVHKAGYLVPAYGDVTIDGFRTSMNDVATFRFSSVRDSYAARKGADRNVRVIGVAFFAERERPRIVESSREDSSHSAGPRRPSAAPAPMATGGASADLGRASESAASAPPPSAKAERPGLGTEFGEARVSPVEYVDFKRADEAHPTSIVQVRYNDREGLMALGIRVDPYPESPLQSDLALRRTASPFPNNRFASAPPPRY